jgi:muconolactone delta-isomerase
MKFLVIVTPKDVPMPPGMVADLLAAQKDWLDQRMADGTAEAVHGFIGGGGMGILNVDSHEQAHALLVESPGFPIADYEVTPLADFGPTIDVAVGTLRRAASMMPGPPG